MYFTRVDLSDFFFNTEQGIYNTETAITRINVLKYR